MGKTKGGGEGDPFGKKSTQGKTKQNKKKQKENHTVIASRGVGKVNARFSACRACRVEATSRSLSSMQT